MKKIKQLCYHKSYMNHLSSLKADLEVSDTYVPVNMNENVNFDQRQSMYELMKSVREVGIPTICGNYTIYYFRLPSQGPHPSVNFIWKGEKDDPSSQEETLKLFISLRGKQELVYSRASKKAVKQTLHTIGITKLHKAEYLLRTLLGDASAPNDLNQAAIL